MSIILRKYVKSILEEIINNFDIVYRGQTAESIENSPNLYIWVTYDESFAKEYGVVKSYKMPKSLNILDTNYYYEWEKLVDEFTNETGDYEEYKYEPTEEFIKYLTTKGYDGFENGNNILLFNKNVLMI